MAKTAPETTPATTPATAPAATAPAPATTPATAPAATAPAPATTPAKFTVLAVTAAVAMPVKEVVSKRGVKSQFPFEALTEVGMSFGVIGRDAKSMSSIVSNANRTATNNPVKKDANGNTVFKMKPVKQADGTEINLPSEEPETVRLKEFVVHNVDPKTDPEGASCRVFRTK